jgi:hypothetical protein
MITPGDHSWGSNRNASSQVSRVRTQLNMEYITLEIGDLQSQGFLTNCASWNDPERFWANCRDSSYDSRDDVWVGSCAPMLLGWMGGTPRWGYQLVGPNQWSYRNQSTNGTSESQLTQIGDGCSQSIHVGHASLPFENFKYLLRCSQRCFSISGYLWITCFYIGQMEVSWNGGAPKSSNCRWIFHYK